MSSSEDRDGQQEAALDGAAENSDKADESQPKSEPESQGGSNEGANKEITQNPQEEDAEAENSSKEDPVTVDNETGMPLSEKDKQLENGIGKPVKENGSPAIDPIDYESAAVLPVAQLDLEKGQVEYKEGIAVDMNGAVDNKEEDHANTAEKEEEKKKEDLPQTGFFEMFRFADSLDYLLIFIGTLAAMAHGAALPLLFVVFGDVISTFVVFEQDQAPSIDTSTSFVISTFSPNYTTIDFSQEMSDAFLEQMNESTYYFCAIGAGALVMGYLQIMCWVLAAERQIHKMRLNFFNSVLRKEIGWFDTHEVGELATRLSDDINKIKSGIGDKAATFLQWFSTFITGFVVGFVYGPKLAAVILAVSPLLAACAGGISFIISSLTTQELKAYASAGAVAEEVLSSMRTVVAFGGEKKEVRRYGDNLHEAKIFGIKKGTSGGIGMGTAWFLIFCTYALGFWYGTTLVINGELLIGDVLIIFFNVIFGAFSLGHALQNLSEFGTARGAAYVVFNILNTKPNIDSMSPEGIKPEKVVGNIEFEDVKFSYPSRPEIQVMKGISLKVNVGQKVALVGPSGCGKSTCVQLIQRFYDPQEGSVKLDGQDIKGLNVKWLREHIGVVSQEPVLFATTIAENIRYGYEKATFAQIERAAKEANAHNFIMELPDGYETLVGERGAQLSGGQKQRVAIARALVRDPKILLLDEATSALDTESESIVQAALDKVSEGRTTIIVAHRLSTIQNADIIAGFENGAVVEQGTHNQLMDKKGVYYELVTQQTHKKVKDEGIDDEEEDEEEDATDVQPDEVKVSELHSEFRGSKKRSSLRKNLKRALSAESKNSEMSNNEAEAEVELPDVPMSRVLRLNKPEWFYMFIGVLSSTIAGGTQPVFAILFSRILDVFTEPENDEKIREGANFYSILFVVMGIISGIAMLFQSLSFAKSGEELTMRLRKLTFEAMLRQEIGYFDDKNNSTGALTTRLATDASAVQGASGPRLGTLMQSIANLGTGIIIAFIYGWQMTLVVLGFAPIMAIGGLVHMKILTGFSGQDKEALEESGKIAVESFENMRTVASLTRERTFYLLYEENLSKPYKKARSKSHIFGLTYGFSQGIIYFVYASAFRFGAYLVVKGEMEFSDVMLVFSAIAFGAMAIGQASAFAPDAAKAAVAAKHIFALIDRTPLIDTSSNVGDTLDIYKTEIHFDEVRFRYPTRLDVAVLKGLNLTVEPGQTVALVGSSGCGKSTSVQLIERFYDPIKGDITLDGHDLRDFNIQWLRSQIGIVSQEPVLFGCSIRENIEYGDNSREVSMEEVIQAAKEANIHSFIETLPLGYETEVGDKGAQLSGGQKQRVAIARALVRNPKILLLDEATSALDTESEKIVQAALDKASQGQTTIVIAHRLSTVRNADKIVVIKHGKVVEEGTHTELLAKNGFYCKLNNAQLIQA